MLFRSPRQEWRRDEPRRDEPRREPRVAPAKRPTPWKPAPVAKPAAALAPAAPQEVSAASVSETPVEKPAPRKEFSPKLAPAKAVGAPKDSRATPPEKTRLYINVGSAMGVTAQDVVGAIMGETGLQQGVVGTIDIRERHLFADVSSEHANSIIAKLNRTRIKENRVKVKVA